jgi:hypothetical protein
MTITLGQLHASMKLLDRLEQAKPDSLKTGYKLDHVIKSARAEAQILADAQFKMLSEYGKQVDGIEGQWEIEASRQEDFGKAWNELLTTEVELWGKSKLEVQELEEMFRRLELTVDEIGRLEWLVDVEIE